jgi:hypothetical protein
MWIQDRSRSIIETMMAWRWAARMAMAEWPGNTMSGTASANGMATVVNDWGDERVEKIRGDETEGLQSLPVETVDGNARKG